MLEYPEFWETLLGPELGIRTANLLVSDPSEATAKLVLRRDDEFPLSLPAESVEWTGGSGNTRLVDVNEELDTCLEPDNLCLAST